MSDVEKPTDVEKLSGHAPANIVGGIRVSQPRVHSEKNSTKPSSEVSPADEKHTIESELGLHEANQQLVKVN